MRHRKAGFKLNRTAPHRRALMRNLVTSLFEHGQILTTEAKAKALRPFAERLITLGKRGDLHARRQALRWVRGKVAARKLFEEIAPRYAERPGGYTRIVKAWHRDGDAAPLAMIQLIPEGERYRNDERGRRRRKRKDTVGSSPQGPGAASGSGVAAPAHAGS